MAVDDVTGPVVRLLLLGHGVRSPFRVVVAILDGRALAYEPRRNRREAKPRPKDAEASAHDAM
jgi:hypothetical protein